MLEAPAVGRHLERLGARPSQRRHLAEAVDAALLRFDADRVSAYLTDRARTAQTVTYLLAAFTEYADDIAQMEAPFRREDYEDEAAFLRAVADVQAAADWLDAGAPLPPAPAPEPIPEPEPCSEPTDDVVTFDRPASVVEQGTPITRGRPSLREQFTQHKAQHRTAAS
ncbi:hypothetical protein [Nocardia sp. CC201C]|uniref:hypothetical protein n=1 Tax=Nocardia sp. CC201C TaxID=3044575 RepID=UPI0024A8DB1E|nr:hypothetical protein [Nocardia sp. CC201C]